MKVRPVTFREACAYVKRHHRHHKPPRGMKFALSVQNAKGEIVGVATVGRPVARHDDNGLTVEVNRTCTDGTFNANSMLYGAARRVAFAMGYDVVITFIQEGESGASLRAAGFVKVADLPARGSWAQSSLKLRHIRDAKGSGGVGRQKWEVRRG